MMISNQTNICKDIETIFDTSSSCFDGVPTPNLTNCDLLILIYRFIIIDCYIERLFYPIAGCLIFIGTVLNLFSLYCFLKMNKRNSQNVYLSALSLGDTISLHVNFTIPLLRQIEVINNYFDTISILCRLNGFLTEFFLIFPTWIVVLLTFERLICILWPLKCYSLYTHKRAKSSIFILAVIVMCLCIYRFFDVKGIDQTNVFAIAACDNSESESKSGKLKIISYINLFIWAILPEFLTLIMNLFIIYNIKLATQKFEPFYSKARQTKYNQATKTALLISILFLIFHTPTGIAIILNLIYTTVERTIGLTIILVSRKLTVILYEINLCCKFFIYNQTFRNFKIILHTSLSRFTRQTNSAKLGRPVINANSINNYHGKAIQFTYIKRHNICHAKETDGLVHHQRKSSTKTSTSTSKTSRDREQQHMTVIMMKVNTKLQVSLLETPNLLRRYTTETKSPSSILKNRLLWRHKPQITL